MAGTNDINSTADFSHVAGILPFYFQKQYKKSSSIVTYCFSKWNSRATSPYHDDSFILSYSLSNRAKRMTSNVTSRYIDSHHDCEDRIGIRLLTKSTLTDQQTWRVAQAQELFDDILTDSSFGGCQFMSCKQFSFVHQRWFCPLGLQTKMGPKGVLAESNWCLSLSFSKSCGISYFDWRPYSMLTVFRLSK